MATARGERQQRQEEEDGSPADTSHGLALIMLEFLSWCRGRRIRSDTAPISPMMCFNGSGITSFNPTVVDHRVGPGPKMGFHFFQPKSRRTFAQRLIDEHARWLSRALRSRRAYPQIPVKKVSEGGFARLGGDATRPSDR